MGAMKRRLVATIPSELNAVWKAVSENVVPPPAPATSIPKRTNGRIVARFTGVMHRLTTWTTTGLSENTTIAAVLSSVVVPGNGNIPNTTAIAKAFVSAAGERPDCNARNSGCVTFVRMQV